MSYSLDKKEINLIKKDNFYVRNQINHYHPEIELREWRSLTSTSTNLKTLPVFYPELDDTLFIINYANYTYFYSSSYLKNLGWSLVPLKDKGEPKDSS